MLVRACDNLLVRSCFKLMNRLLPAGTFTVVSILTLLCEFGRGCTCAVPNSLGGEMLDNKMCPGRLEVKLPVAVVCRNQLPYDTRR